MIDWDATERLSGGRSFGELKLRQKICLICDHCQITAIISFRSKKSIIGNQYQWVCTKCRSNSPEHKSKMAEISKRLWQNPVYISNNLQAVRSEDNIAKLSKRWRETLGKVINTQEYRERHSSSIKKLWESSEYRKKITDSSLSIWENKELKEQMLLSRTTDEYRENQRKKAKERWADPRYVELQQSAKAMATRSPVRLAEIRRLQSKVSHQQEILYSILEDLKISFYREYNDRPDDEECVIGPYSFDCVIPRADSRLLIECQGDYWHSLKKNRSRDAAKSTYISTYFPQYELKYIWEHEFLNRNKIQDLLKYWLGITQSEIVDFKLSDVVIKPCDGRSAKMLLSKYHYLPTQGRNGIAYGAFFGGTLVGVIVYSPPIRQNHDPAYVRELSRLCIHPSYQKKNFASWLIGRSLRLLDKKFTKIISYSDTTFNHVGTVYKASNFLLDGEVKPDYWYVSSDGWVMHKKTLYNHAVKMKTVESKYAEQNGYIKVYGQKKLRYVYNR